MPTPVFPTAYKVEVKGSLFGVPLMNVWYVQGPDPFSLSDATTIAGIFNSSYGALLTHFSQDISFNEIEVSNLGGVATGSFSLFITPPAIGTVIQDSMPGNVAICVSLRSALAGRRFRGRKYFSGLGEGHVTGNLFDSTEAGQIVTEVNNLITDLATAGNPLSIFSPTGLTLVPVVTALMTDLTVDSQRGRLH